LVPRGFFHPATRLYGITFIDDANGIAVNGSRLGKGFAWIKDVGVPSIQGIWDVLANGNFSGPIFGLEEDSGLVDYLFNLRDAGMAAWAMLKSGWEAATNLAAALAPFGGLFGRPGWPGLWGLRSAPRTYFPVGDCVLLQATGISPSSFGGERSPGRRCTSSMGRWCPSGGACSQNNLWIVL